MQNLKNILITTFGVASTRILSLIIGIFATWMMDISTFGQFTLFFTIFVLVSEIPEASNITYISRLKHDISDNESKSYLALNFLWKFSYLILVTTISLLLFYLNSKWNYSNTTVLQTIVFASISGGLVGVYSGLQAYYLAQKKYLLVAILRPLFLLIIFILFLFSLIFHKKIEISLVYIYFIIAASAVVLLTIWLTWKEALITPPKSQTNILGFVKHSSDLTLYSLINLIATRIDVFVISSLLLIEDLGIYGVALRVAGVVGLMVTVINIYMLPKAKKALQIKKDYSSYRRDSIMLGIFVVLIAGLSLVLIEPVILAVFGGIYSSAVLPASLLIIAVIISALGMPMQLLLQVSDNVSLLYKLSFVKLVIAIPLSYFLITNYQIIGAALSLILINLLTFITLWFMSQRLLITNVFHKVNKYE